MAPRYAAQWEENARLDPFWAVLTRAEGAWTEADFFATGEEEITRVFGFLQAASLAPARRERFLDFGCGVGRVTAALGRRFRSGVGLDVSPSMIALGRQHLASRAPAVTLSVIDTPERWGLGAEPFSFVYCHMVLQHMTPGEQRGWITRLVEALEPGGIAALQTVEARVGIGRRSLRSLLPDGLRSWLRAARGRLSRRAPRPARPVVAMHALPARQMARAVAAAGGRVLAAPFTNSAAADHRGRVEFFDAAEAWRRVATGAADNPLLARFYFVTR
jgi:2-polyprenyl-3-methyl-5-hydroxy-6-metoxy-1,4-benzoquinol methylase